MAVSSISCSLRPPPPVREASSARLTPPPTTPWAAGLRRACVAAAAACVVIGAAGGGDAATTTTPRDAVVSAAAAAPRGPRWSDRRECPPWRANSLENVVPENLPRPSARRRFNSVIKRAPRNKQAPAIGRTDAVAPPPFLALSSGLLDDCFTL